LGTLRETEDNQNDLFSSKDDYDDDEHVINEVRNKSKGKFSKYSFSLLAESSSTTTTTNR
jgi:hypothetical protein